MKLSEKLLVVFLLLNPFDGQTQTENSSEKINGNSQGFKSAIQFQGVKVACGDSLADLVFKPKIADDVASNSELEANGIGRGSSDCIFDEENGSLIDESSSKLVKEEAFVDTDPTSTTTELPTTLKPTAVTTEASTTFTTPTTSSTTEGPISAVSTTSTATEETASTVTTTTTSTTTKVPEATSTDATTEVTTISTESTITEVPTEVTTPTALPITTEEETTSSKVDSTIEISTTNTQIETTISEVTTTTTSHVETTDSGKTTSELETDREKCNETQLVGHEIITWDVEVKPGKYFANPHCLDEQNLLVSRTCVSGKFSNQTNCAKIQHPFNKCAEDLFDTQTECLTVLPEATYHESKCPYDYLKPFSMKPMDFPVWYPAKRNLNYGIGEFEIDEFSVNFGSDPSSAIYYDTKRFADANCIAFINQSLVAVSCNSKFKKICYYDYLNSTLTSFCSKKGACMKSEFGKNLQCICVSNKAPEETCKVTEITKPYQYVAKSLCKQTCSLKMKVIDTLRWSSSNATVKSTDWDYTTTKISKDFKEVSVDVNGWSIKEHQNVFSFHLCNFPKKLPKITITGGREIRLIYKIENKDYLAISPDGFYLFCFTDAHSNRLVTRILSLKPGGTESFVIKESGQYWCEGFEVGEFQKIVSNKYLIIFENIYPIEVSFAYGLNEDPTSSAVAYSKFISNLERIFNSDYSQSVKMKWMKTSEVDETAKIVKYLIHVCIDSQYNLLGNYQRLKENLVEKFKEMRAIEAWSDLFTVAYCMEEETEHNGVKLFWPTTYNNSYAVNRRCFNKAGKYARRFCKFDYLHGARWSEPEECSLVESKSEATDELSEILNGNQTAPELSEKLLNITENTEKFEPVDVQLVSSILEKFLDEDSALFNVTKVVSNVMETKNKTMQSAQSCLNATDTILYNFDRVLKRTNVANSVLIQTNNVLTTIFDASTQSIIGLGLINMGKDFSSFKIYQNMSIKDVAKIPNLEVATILPHKLLKEIRQSKDSKVAITIYLTHSLFNEEVKTHEVAAKNFGILLPKTVKTPYKISLLFRLRGGIPSRKHSCGFWRYGLSGSEAIKGQWKPESKSKIDVGWRLQLCEFSHVTHFGLLIMDEDLIEDSKVLDVITSIECALSIFGILGIFTTALIFKNWRRNEGNQILVHYGVISFSQIIFLYISNAVRTETQWICIIIGSLLHYTVLSQFCWMLFIAYLQYKRYVLVLEGRTSCLLFKAYFLSYVLPAIPVLTILSFSSDNYTEGRASLCYPTGNGLIYGLLIPIGIIVSINILVFSRIIYELFCKDKVNDCVEDDVFVLRLRLVFLMFFMLGITWVFGFAAQIFESDFCVYLFSITASIQGFVLFLFFIVCNANARVMYVYLWRKYSFKYFY